MLFGAPQQVLPLGQSVAGSSHSIWVLPAMPASTAAHVPCEIGSQSEGGKVLPTLPLMQQSCCFTTQSIGAPASGPKGQKRVVPLPGCSVGKLPQSPAPPESAMPLSTALPVSLDPLSLWTLPLSVSTWPLSL